MIQCYFKSKNGDVKLADHFKVREFACKDGTDVLFIDDELVKLLEQIRQHFGKPVIINSGYRTPSHNKHVGGATYSQHMLGKACDIHISGVTPQEIYFYVCTLMPSTGGVGLYKNFVHLDTRPTKTRWIK